MRILFFSSHTATWYFAVQEALLAYVLRKEGHDVIFITPGNSFKKIADTRQEAILDEEFDLNKKEIGQFLSNKDSYKIKNILKKLNRNNFEKLSIDGVNIGKISLYEFVLHGKKIHVKLNNEEWNQNKFYFEYTLRSFFACRKVLNKYKPDCVMMYGDLYSVNRVWDKYAQKIKIPVYYLQNGTNFSDINNTLVVARTNSIDFFRRLIKIWRKVKNIPIGKSELSYVTDNFYELLAAKHFLVYSAPKSKSRISIRNLFNIENEQKILVATMSSYDEMLAAQYVGAWKLKTKPFFSNQIEWIKFITKYVSSRKNLFLIIRVHPREFPNKREGKMSEHAKMLEKVLVDLPDNVKVNWPTDNISLYDLAQETDVFLNAWSSVGVEMNLLGIPVVLYSGDLVLYPPDLNYVAKTKLDYFKKIESALNDGWKYERIKYTYRWLSLLYGNTIIRIGPKKVMKRISTTHRLIAGILNIYSHYTPFIFRKMLVKVYYSYFHMLASIYQRKDCKNRISEKVNTVELQKMIKKLDYTMVDVDKIKRNRISEKNEDKYIRNELRKIYSVMYGESQDNFNNDKKSLQSNLKDAIVKI